MSDSVDHGDQELPPGYSIPVLYDDGEILIVDKPWDIRVDGRFPVTVEKLVRKKELVENICGLGRELDAFRLCNQLDYATSGVLVLGLSHKGAGNCNKLFSGRKTKKLYLAIGSGECTLPLGVKLSVFERISEVKDSFCMQIDSVNGKECQTDLIPVCPISMKNGPNGVLFLVRLITGRRHQIRLHLKHIGFPIVGDATYNSRPTSRMMLHAWKLFLPFSPDKTVAVEAPPNEFFSHTTNNLDIHKLEEYSIQI